MVASVLCSGTASNCDEGVEEERVHPAEYWLDQPSCVDGTADGRNAARADNWPWSEGEVRAAAVSTGWTESISSFLLVIRYGIGFGKARARPQGRDAQQYEDWMSKDYEDEATAVRYLECNCVPAAPLRHVLIARWCLCGCSQTGTG